MCRQQLFIVSLIFLCFQLEKRLIKRDTLEELIEQQRNLDEDRLSFRSHDGGGRRKQRRRPFDPDDPEPEEPVTKTHLIRNIRLLLQEKEIDDDLIQARKSGPPATVRFPRHAESSLGPDWTPEDPMLEPHSHA
eukprot:TRINITY_DN11741_c0_g1_i5.p1 TRINITY_DN11741_c0_g1~~TRINITY_DN11741_c0_g1_i5.p1  ORF type:complete len:134 (-),score=36.39 TRINITY_DN11741_c0_g1_i5:94-495(-)